MTTQAAAVETDSGEDAAQQELEGRARLQGWKPKDEYRGPADVWMEAADFLKNIEAKAPLQNERLRFLGDKLEKSVRAQTQLNARLETQQRTINEQGQFIKANLSEIVNRGRRAEAGAFERQRTTIKSRMRDAVKASNPEEYDRLERELDELEKSPPQVIEEDEEERKPAPVQQRQPTREEVEDLVSPTTRAWIAQPENSWFKTDEELNGHAVIMHGANVQSGMSEEASLAKVSRDIRRRYADKFENERRDQPASVSQPAPPGSSKPKGKTVNDLPPEAQLALQQLKHLIPKKPDGTPGYTDAEYLAEYKW